jgi:hypothetical protein
LQSWQEPVRLNLRSLNAEDMAVVEVAVSMVVAAEASMEGVAEASMEGVAEVTSREVVGTFRAAEDT